MDPVYQFPASPGTPLFPVSPERANRQPLPQSPSLPSDLHDPFKMAHLRENSDVQNKVAQFNSLSKEAAQRRKDNEAAMRRAILGREEAESEARRLRDENRAMRKEMEEGKNREKRVAQRIETVMEELGQTKETQARAKDLYEKEVRRARKEAFKSSSALVNTQEELKTTRNRYTLMREEVEVQKRKVESKDQEAFAAQYQMVGLQEQLDSAKQRIKVVEEERDAVKTSLQHEELARIAAEGKIALPPADDSDELTSPRKRRRESLKENVDPNEQVNVDPSMDAVLEVLHVEQEDPLQGLKADLRAEKKLRTRAEKMIDFMKMECQFQCCPCRTAEQQGTQYIHDGALEKEMDKVWAKIPKNVFTQKKPLAMPPPAPSEAAHSSPPGASSPPGQTTEMLINFSPSMGSFYRQPTPIKRELPEIPPLSLDVPDDANADPNPRSVTSETHAQGLPTFSASCHQPKPYFAPHTPRPLPIPPIPHTTQATIRSVTYPGTTTTSIPLAPIPVSPDRTISREEALEQIRQRRGRARSIAQGNGTPRKIASSNKEERMRMCVNCSNGTLAKDLMRLKSVGECFCDCASGSESHTLMAMAPIEDDFVLTISDNEAIEISSENEEAPAQSAPSTKASNKKRKRDDLGDKNLKNGTRQASKKQKKAKRKSKPVSDDNASDKEEGQSWAAGGKDDGAIDSDFEFQVQGPDNGVFEDFDGWDIDLEKSNVQKQGDKKGVDIDALIAKRREEKGTKPDTNGIPKSNGDDQDMDDESEILDIEVDENNSSSQEQDDEGEDETLAADGFGMGATGLDEESNVESQDNEEHESEHTSDDDSVAEPVAHPDDEASNAPTENEHDDPAELARQKEFFAPEEDVKKPTSKEISSNGFQNMSLSRPILRGLASLGFSTPTPIQSKTIPIALLGKDVVGGAVTGSGKTAAFIVPILERLLYRPKKIPTSRVAILMPTRELAVQCFNVAQKLASFTDITFSLLSGGFSLRAQETHLRTRPDILIATPGRFIDHMRNSHSFTVSTLEILVLDEADRMLDDGFSKEIDEILTTIPQRRQTLLFSATMTSRVDKLIRLGLQRPVRILINAQPQTVQTLTQEFVRLRPGREEKRLAALLHLCTTVFTTRTIIFFRQKKLAHRIRVLFALCDITASELHGDMTQEQRLNALTSFKTGQ
ncbi:MAG: hypothetical protein Q9174_003081, partial [Haloplaca sp. 1 TL-2023]